MLEPCQYHLVNHSEPYQTVPRTGYRAVALAFPPSALASRVANPRSLCAPKDDPATVGSVLFKGEDVTFLGPDKRTRRGIGRAFQLTNLFPNLTVLANVRLAVQSHAGHGVDLFSIASRHRDLIDKAHHYLDRVALTALANAHAAALSHGDQRKLEVALMLALESDIFMFDEPTAGMSVDEVPVLLDLIEAIKRTGDKTILLVEHKIDVVRRLADRIIVLTNSTQVADGDPATVVALPVVQEAYLGIRRKAPLHD